MLAIYTQYTSRLSSYTLVEAIVQPQQAAQLDSNMLVCGLTYFKGTIAELAKLRGTAWGSLRVSGPSRNYHRITILSWAKHKVQTIKK